MERGPGGVGRWSPRGASEAVRCTLGAPTSTQVVTIQRLSSTLAQVSQAPEGDGLAAQDILQDAILALCDTLLRGDSIADVGPWLRSTVRHKAIDWVRARARERGALAGLAQHLPDGPPDPAQAAEHADTVRHVLEHVETLPEGQRLAVRLLILESRSPDEAAQALGVKPETVRRQCRQALAALRETLGAEIHSSDGEP